MKNQHGQVRVLISDFGLCKRLQYGYSVTQSGLIGTDGLIAPELYNMHDKIVNLFFSFWIDLEKLSYSN